MSKINYFCVLLLQFFVFSVVSQTTVHAVIFAATEDLTIGKGNQVSYEMIREELSRIDKNDNDVSVKFYPFINDNFRKEKLPEIRKQLKNQSQNLANEVVFFIFIGHGFNKQSEYVEYPNLVFLNTEGGESDAEIEQNSEHLKTIIQDFQALQPRLLVAFAEACNNNYLEGEKPLSEMKSLGNYRVASLISSPEEKVKELFQETDGLVIFTSSNPSQPSYVHETEGGVYSQAFVKALQLETSDENAGKASFKSIANEAEKFVKQTADNYSWNQNPQYIQNLKGQISNENSGLTDTDPVLDDPNIKQKKRGLVAWLIAKIAPNTVKRKFKKAYDKGDLISLNMGIKMDDSGDRLRKKMYAKTPVMYFTSEALYWEVMKDTAKALKNYSIAFDLYKNGYFSPEDQKLMKQMSKMDKKNLTGIKNFGVYQRWLENKLGIYQTIFEEEIEEEDETIADSSVEIEQLENKIQENRNVIEDIKTQMATIQNQIDEIDIPRERTVEVTLNNAQKDAKKTIKEISDVVKKAKSEGMIDNGNNEVIIGDSDAMVKFKFGKRKMNSNLRPDVKGYKLGQHCTADIQELTNDLMAILLERVDDVPTEKRDEIEVELQITGNADWRGGENKLGIYYKSTENIDEEYQDRNGESQNFYIETGESKNITNTELAFLRGYCAWQNIRQILSDKGISINDENVHFTAIAWPKSETDSNKNSGEPDKRGVDISMTINNLYKHYMDKIKELENELEILREQIAKKETDISKIKERILELEQEINNAEARKEELEDAMDTADPNQENSEAGYLIKNVKDVWNG